MHIYILYIKDSKYYIFIYMHRYINTYVNFPYRLYDSVHDNEYMMYRMSNTLYEYIVYYYY